MIIVLTWVHTYTLIVTNISRVPFRGARGSGFGKYITCSVVVAARFFILGHEKISVSLLRECREKAYSCVGKDGKSSFTG